MRLFYSSRTKLLYTYFIELYIYVYRIHVLCVHEQMMENPGIHIIHVYH